MVDSEFIHDIVFGLPKCRAKIQNFATRYSAFFFLNAMLLHFRILYDVTGRSYVQSGGNQHKFGQLNVATLYGNFLSTPFVVVLPANASPRLHSFREVAKFHGKHCTNSRGRYRAVRKFKSTLSLLAHRCNRGCEKVGRNATEEQSFSYHVACRVQRLTLINPSLNCFILHYALK